MLASRALPLCRHAGTPGFTATDLLVALAVVTLVATVVAAPVVRAKQQARLAQCTANLGQLSRAVLSFCGDHAQTLPAGQATPGRDLWFWYKEDVKGYAGLTGASSPADTLFACPDDRGYADARPFHHNPRFDYNSYVFNGVTLPGVPHIAGWQLAAVRAPARTLLVMEWTAHAPLSWHKSKTGRQNAPFYSDAQSVVGFVDGHVGLVRIYYDGYNAAYTRDPIDGYDYKYSGD
jgi:type II secretory pathway pseudopilin PulG